MGACKHCTVALINLDNHIHSKLIKNTKVFFASPKENPVLPDSFNQIYIIFPICFCVGPTQMHNLFRIGLPKIHRLYLYYDERRDIRWYIAWARGKSRGRSPRNFPRTHAIFHRISRLGSEYRHSQFLKVILSVLSFLVGQYRKSWFSILVWQLGLYFPVLPSRWSNMGPYRLSRELCCGSTRKYTLSGEKY